MHNFNIGDYVYGGDWCYGQIIEMESDGAHVEFNTERGGGTVFFEWGELVPADDTSNSYDDIFIYVPDFRQIVRIAEGTGGNLLDWDIDAGYVDYIYYDQHELDADLPNVDGGQIMLKELLRDKFKTIRECIPMVLEMAYGSPDLNYMVL